MTEEPKFGPSSEKYQSKKGKKTKVLIGTSEKSGVLGNTVTNRARDCLDRATPVHSSGLGRTVCLYLSAVFGAWLADVGIRRRLRLCCRRRSLGDWRTGVSPHHTMAGGDVGGIVTDGADSPAAAGWSDRARAVALKPQPGWFQLRLQTWVALATTNGQARE